MSSELILQRLRRFLLLLAAGLCVGTVVELALTEHTGEPLQWVPFALCGLGFAAIAAALLSPRRATFLTLRGVMLLMMLGSLLGIYEHIQGNIGFALEIRPHAGVSAVFLDALAGANPLLAPGILALAGVIALAAIYHHPALSKQSEANT
jgi:hypothetical protein